MDEPTSNPIQRKGRNRAIQGLRQQNSKESTPDREISPRGRVQSDEAEETEPMDASITTIPSRISSKDKLHRAVNKIRGTPMKGEINEYIEPVMELTKHALKNEDGELDEKDAKFMKTLEAGIKYAPKIAEFLTTIAGNIRGAQAPQQRGNMIQPPPGWQGMSVMEKLARKWNGDQISAWYAQGIAYEQSLDTTGTATNYYPPPQGQPISRKPEWQPSVEQGNPNVPPPLNQGAPNTELSKSNHIPPEELAKMNQPQLTEQQQQDAQMVGMALNKLEDTPNSQVLEALANEEQTIEKIKPFIAFLPESLKVTLKEEKIENILEAVRQHCPSKQPLLADEVTAKRLKALLEKLQKEI